MRDPETPLEGGEAGRRRVPGPRGRHVRRRVPAPPGAGGGRARLEPQGRENEVLRGAAGEARTAPRVARVHVGLGALSAQARGRARGSQTRPAAAQAYLKEE